MNKYFKYLIPILTFLLIIILTSCQSKEIRELETKIILLEEENSKLKKELEERPVTGIIMESASEEYEFEGKEISGEELMEKANELLEIVEEKNNKIKELEAEIESMEGEDIENIKKESSENKNNNSTEEIAESDSSNNASNIQPVIDSATDSLGHIQTWSAAKDNLDDWPHPSPIIYIGDVITFTINVSNSSELLYKFDYQPAGGCFITIQDWSNSNICTWTVPKKAFGKWIPIAARVKNNDGLNFLGSCDDYANLTYTVLSK